MLVPKSFGLKNSSVQKNFPETSLNFPEDTLETSLTFKIILQAPKTLIKKKGTTGRTDKLSDNVTSRAAHRS